MNTIKSFFGKVFRFIKYSIYTVIVVAVIVGMYGAYIDSNDPVRIAEKAAIAEQQAIAIAEQDAIEAEQKHAKKQKGFHCLSGWDGSLVHDRVIKNSMKNPDSYEHIETRITPVMNGNHLAIIKYRAQNGFGGMSFGTMKVTVSNATCQITQVVSNV
jgi:hypothetical protein|tara:strand:- start:512 stop:982 length:471 start_codon:yes stop_codon:yes gene_type:complete